MPHALDPMLAGLALALLGFAALHDLATRTVPNAVALGLAALGFGLSFLQGQALAAAVIAAALLLSGLLLVWRGAWGGADAKLVAAVAVGLSPAATGTFLLATAFAGGALALLYVLLSRLIPRPAPGPRRTWLARVAKAEAWRMRRQGPLPYAAAIACGGAYAFLPLLRRIALRARSHFSVSADRPRRRRAGRRDAHGHAQEPAAPGGRRQAGAPARSEGNTPLLMCNLF